MIRAWAARDQRQDGGDSGHGAAPVQSAADLTPRQQQIMQLLRAGKVNKEIARELGIGVGTVKQHVVTLFKRLNVSNRTMAVSRGMELAAAPPSAPQAAPAHGAAALERRPCVLLSLGLAAPAEEAALRRLHGLLATLACEMDAVFLARRGQVGDLIFGLHQVAERDLRNAVESAQRLHAEVGAVLPQLAPALRGGMTVGIVVASMLRHGGWSGEAVASTALASARELQEQAAGGQVLLGRSVLSTMQALGIRGEAWFGAGAGPGALALGGMPAIDWRNTRRSYPLVGRAQQLAVLAGLLQGGGRVLALEGETGMGKSRLCAAAMELWQGAQRGASLFRAVADERSGAAAMLAAAAPGALAIVDDCHLLAPALRSELLAAARGAAQAGAVVLLAGRHCPELAAADVLRLPLPRLSVAETAALAGCVLAQEGQAAGAAPEIAEQAAGVPLFAVELARHQGEEGMAISLLATVCARLDGLHLDRKLLRAAARQRGAMDGASLAAALGESEAAVLPALQRALAAGVLRQGPAGGLEFGHPLLRKIIDYLSLE